MSGSTRYDVAIIGAGMVGASLALALLPLARARGLRIALLEAHPLPATTDMPLSPSFDARATALSYGSGLLLDRLGVWAALTDRVAPIAQVRVSDRGHFGAARLDATEENVAALGYVVENRVLGQALLQRLAAEGRGVVDLLCPARVSSALMQPQGVQLSVAVEAGQQTLTAELVVMADGGRSTLAEQLGLDYQRRDYAQRALIANVRLQRPHGGVAYERFTASGPMALLPLQDDAEGQPRAALVWSAEQARCEALLAMPDAAFVAELQNQFGYRAGRLLGVGGRSSYPLNLMRIREQVRPNLIALGNAAHTLHPIAGQGFNLALRGVMVLADELASASAAGARWGDIAVLARVEARCRWDQDKTIGFSDQVTRLFSTERRPAVIGRNLGLLALDLCPPVKREFARSAMGLDAGL